MSRSARLPLVVAWAIFATYVLAARGVRNFFPVSVFDMYQAHAPEVAARVIVLDAAGRAAEIEDFEGYVCDVEPPLLRDVERSCGAEHRPLAYVTRDQELYVAAHRGEGPGPGPDTITIVSRAHALAPGSNRPAQVDCVIARCTARRRGGPS